MLTLLPSTQSSKLYRIDLFRFNSRLPGFSFKSSPLVPSASNDRSLITAIAYSWHPSWFPQALWVPPHPVPTLHPDGWLCKWNSAQIILLLNFFWWLPAPLRAQTAPHQGLSAQSCALSHVPGCHWLSFTSYYPDFLLHPQPLPQPLHTLISPCLPSSCLSSFPLRTHLQYHFPEHPSLTSVDFPLFSSVCGHLTRWWIWHLFVRLSNDWQYLH